MLRWLPLETSSEVETPTLDSSFAKKRLRLSSMIQSEDQVRWEALRKFKVMLTINPGNSFLGSTLAEKALLLRHEAEISSSFSDAFSGKSAGTLTKRASSCWRFVTWTIQQGHIDPLAVGEPVFYAYMNHLRDHGAPTTATTFIESWTFFVPHGRAENSATWDGSFSTWCVVLPRTCLLLKGSLYKRCHSP